MILLFHFLPTLKQLISSLRLNSSDVLDKHFDVHMNIERRKGSKRELEFQLGIFIETVF